MKKTSPKVKNIKLAHQFVATEARHRLSHKTWAELIAETELPMTTKRTVDLAALFKKEMEVILREQERPLDQQKPVVRMKTAFEPKVMSQQSAATIAPQHRARRFAA